jgi:hypothetical protein
MQNIVIKVNQVPIYHQRHQYYRPTWLYRVGSHHSRDPMAAYVHFSREKIVTHFSSFSGK